MKSILTKCLKILFFSEAIAYEKLVEALTKNSLLKGIKQASRGTDQLLRGIPLCCKPVCPEDAGLLLLRDVEPVSDS